MAEEGVLRSRAKLLLKLLFGEIQPKTRSLIEEICLGVVEEEALSMTSFETFMRNVLLSKEAFDIAGDIYDHLVLLKGSKVKVSPLLQDLCGRLLQISRKHGEIKQLSQCSHRQTQFASTRYRRRGAKEVRYRESVEKRASNTLRSAAKHCLRTITTATL